MAWTTPETAVAGDVLTAAWLNQNLRDNLNAVGLVHIATLSDTSVAEFLFSDVFTTDSDHYVVVFDVTTDSSTTLLFRFRDSGGDYTTGYYCNNVGSNFDADSVAYGARRNNGTEGGLGVAINTGGSRAGVMNIHRPADSTVNTTFHGTLAVQAAAEGYVFGGRGAVDDHTGIRFYAGTGTISGQVKLYRYAGS